MKQLPLGFVLGAMLLASGCTNTVAGVSSDWDQFKATMQRERDYISARMPMGYSAYHPSAAHHLSSVPYSYSAMVKPPTMMDAWAGEPVVESKNFNGSVTVFPIDDEFDLVFQPRYGSNSRQLSRSSEGMAPIQLMDGSGTGFSGGYTDGGELSMSMAEKIFFLHGSSRLSAADLRKISDVAAQAASGGYTVKVVGHASRTVYNVSDPMRRSLINLAMSAKRANAAGDALHNAGLSRSRIEVEAAGDKRQNHFTGGMSQDDADRRVEMILK